MRILLFWSMIRCIIFAIVILWLPFCELGFAVKRTERAKSIDLNRTPSSESSTDNRNISSQRPKTQDITYKRKGKLDQNSPAYQAKQIADASGHSIDSKEYKAVYRKYIRQIRDEQKKDLAKVSSAAKADWKTVMEKRRQYSKAHRDRIQQRKKDNMSTPEDLKYFRNNHLRQRRRYLKDPQKFRLRAIEWYHKNAAAKAEGQKKNKDQDPDQVQDPDQNK